MKRFSIVENGYDVNEVNRFIDVVIKRLESLNNEVKLYQEEINDLNKIIDKKKEDDYKINKALLAIQETSDQMKEFAKKEANFIVEEARRNANAIVHEALLNASEKEQEVMLLQKNITIYKAKIKSLVEAQLKIVDEIEKIEL